ncbi:PAS domain-containing protein [Pelagicoccus albus]|uniref:PAS domain-containing protein n=1 Tax=Pelagicoccus albus TaxID=415222 RepID=A0A7X1B676_9BACT|nr:PAS domain-containing protein [Pelagicoccus albus]MBC2606370.1 PAS domain-containing protein [Pelagicoccus albus]
MKKQALLPTGIEQQFEIYETFFSTTDYRGIITAGNSILTRTSGYSLDELIGSPHNLIRHPSMPRCVFAMLWENAKDRQPFAGYVINQAKNGNHYWVFALIEPQAEEIISIRIKPSCGLLSTIQSLYPQLLQAEDDALANGESIPQAIQRSKALLAEAVQKLGFQDYEAFSHYSINAEIRHRDSVVKKQGRTLFPTSIPSTSDQVTQEAYYRAKKAYQNLGSVFTELDNFTRLAKEIKDGRDAVRDIADEFRLNALNANIAATPLGGKGATIETITRFLHSHAGEFSDNTSSLADQAAVTTSSIQRCVARLASARIQMETLINYLCESSYSGDSRLLAGMLSVAVSENLIHAERRIHSILKSLSELGRKQEALQRAITAFNVAQTSGLMECSRLPEAKHLTSMFSDLRQRIEDANTELADSERILDKLKSLAAAAPPKIKMVIASLRTISGREPKLPLGIQPFSNAEHSMLTFEPPARNAHPSVLR